MSDPVYTRVGPAPQRLYALNTVTDSGVTGYWGGYFSSSSPSLDNTASAAQAWADTGVFLYLAQTPDDLDTFSTSFGQYLDQVSSTGKLRMVWIENPVDPWSRWRAALLNATPDGDGTWRGWGESALRFGQYAVRIRNSAVLSFTTPGTIGVAEGGAAFSCPNGSFGASNASFPLSGPSVGGFSCSVVASGKEGDDFVRLGAEIRYGVCEEKENEDPSLVTQLRQPVLRQGSTAFTLLCAFDPLNPFRLERTRLQFDLSAFTPSFESYFVTSLGHAVTLTPQSLSSPFGAAQLGFARTPLFSATTPEMATYAWSLCPDGPFLLNFPTTGGDMVHRVMLGSSGTEYVFPRAGEDILIYFAAGKPGFAPPASIRGTDMALLTELGTTAYVTIVPKHSNIGYDYYAQPNQASLFNKNTAQPSTDPFLDFHEMKAAVLPPATTTAPTVYPVGVYSGIDPSLISAAKLLEVSALAPVRRELIGLPSGNGDEELYLTATDAAHQAVTPQGLVSILSQDLSKWAGVLLANMPASVNSEVKLTAVGAKFQAALQTNQLFTVVADVEHFMSQSSIAYQLTEANAMTAMSVAQVDPTVAQSVYTILQGLGFKYFDTEMDFIDAVHTAYESAPDPDTQKSRILSAAGALRCDIEGWNFQLSPRSWRKTDSKSPTVMLIKFCNRSIEELVEDPESWGWKGAAGDVGATQKLLKKIIDDARNKSESDSSSPYAAFYEEVVANPLWNGFLFLNAVVDFTRMPQELRFLAAGVNDFSKFFAHHIGFSMTPFTAGETGINLGQTAAFGLIDYNDPEDLYASETIPFGFKTLALRVSFANAKVSDFSATAELMVNTLFGSPLRKENPERGNNLVIDGTYQRVGSLPSYAFILEGKNDYLVSNAALVRIGVESLRLETSSTGEDGVEMRARFVLSGSLRFIEIPAFDLFSYGFGGASESDALRFSGLAIAMSFPVDAPANQRFSVAEGAIAFDLSNSTPRPASLVARFPLQLVSLVSSPVQQTADGPVPGQTPGDMGYTSISAKGVEQTPLTSPWCGLVFNIDLGSLGALTGAIGIKLSLLAAWAPGSGAGETPPVFVGLKFADSKGLGGMLPLQGVLRLGFRSFQFETYMNKQDELCYLLRMRRFALSMLVWSFPPGNADLMIYGDPSGPNSSVGWYAAYAEKPSGDKQLEAKSTRAALAPPTGEAEQTTPPALPTAPGAASPAGDRYSRAGRRKPRVH